MAALSFGVSEVSDFSIEEVLVNGCESPIYA